MTVTQLTWDAVEVTPHTTAAPTVSNAYNGIDPFAQEVAAITTGDPSAVYTTPFLMPTYVKVVQSHTTSAIGVSYTTPFLMPTYVKVVQTPTPAVQPVTEGIIFPRGVPTFCS